MIFAFGKITDKRDDERQREESSSADEFAIAVIDHSHEAVPPIEDHHPATNLAQSSPKACRPTKGCRVVCFVVLFLGFIITITTVFVFLSIPTKT